MSHPKCRVGAPAAGFAGAPLKRVERRKGAARGVLLAGVLALCGSAFSSAVAGVPEARYLLTGALDGAETVFDLSVKGRAASFGALGADSVAGRVTGDGVLAGAVQVALPEGALELSLPSFWTQTPEAFLGTLNGQPARLEKRAEYAFESVRQGAFIEVSVSYPVFGAPWQGVNGRIRREIQAPMLRALENGRKLSRAGQLSYPWTHQETLEPTLYSSQVLSLLGTGSVYTGGAHPNTFYRALTFERTPEGVRELALRDLFRGAYAYTLLTEVERKLRARGAAWIADGSVVLQETDLSVFTLTHRGLEFAFAPYAVGPYAQGAFFVTVPHELLENLMHPRFLP